MPALSRAQIELIDPSGGGHPRELRHPAAARHHRGHPQGSGAAPTRSARPPRPHLPPGRGAALAGARCVAEMRADFVRAKRLLARRPAVSPPDPAPRARPVDGRWPRPGRTGRHHERWPPALAGLCRAGDVVLLVGGLGAGKTIFAQGFAAALGVAGPVTSPTFTLVRQYPCAGAGPVAPAGPRRPVPARPPGRGRRPRPARAGRGRAVSLVEWGDVGRPGARGRAALEVDPPP